MCPVVFCGISSFVAFGFISESGKFGAIIRGGTVRGCRWQKYFHEGGPFAVELHLVRFLLQPFTSFSK